MVKKLFPIPLKEGQTLYFIPIGDVHYGSQECDVPRLTRLVQWCQRKKKAGHLVRLLGLGDYFEKGSRTESRAMEDTHEGMKLSMDAIIYDEVKALSALMAPLKGDVLGLLGGHHAWRFVGNKFSGGNGGKYVDEVFASLMGTTMLGNPLSGVLLRLQFPGHRLHLDVFAHHGGGGAQTPGGRVQKRIRIAEIAPTAHIVVTGHDNAKLAYPRSGLDYDEGTIKRYVIGSGSFQRAYLEDERPGFAETLALVPADLGVTIVTVEIEERDGRWRVDFHASV